MKNKKFDYQIRVDDTLTRPVVIYLMKEGCTQEIIRECSIEDAEKRAAEWVQTKEGQDR